MTRTKGPRASEDERKERRRAANRRSARKSRYKENVLLDELQKTVTELAKQNQSLKAENDAFKQDVVALQGLMVCKNNMQLQSVEPSKPTPLLYQSYADSMQNSMLNQQQKLQLSNDVARTPSPVESFNLNLLDPDRIFPIEEGEQKAALNTSLTLETAASNLFRAAFQYSAEAAV